MREKPSTGFLSLEIPQLIDSLPELFADRQILITARDSAPCGPGRFNFHFPFKAWPNATLIPASSMVKFLSFELFEGFDEIYILPDCKVKPILITHTFEPPRFDFAKKLPEDILEIFDTLSAIAFFSDGSGCNFAVPERFVLKLQEISAAS